MKARRRYRITIEDESRLRDIVKVSMRPAALWGVALASVFALILLTSLLIVATPLRNLMPGYLKKGERSAAEAGMLRIDSIKDAYTLNSQYIANILTVLDTDRTATDSVQAETTPNELPPDSLLPASPREIEFISQLKEREKYNVEVLAPLAAGQLRLYPVAAGAIIAENSPNPAKAVIVTPKGSPVCALTDARILAIQNPAPEGGCAIILQHDGGFASRYSHVGTPSVAPGMHVEGGSVIAHGASGGATAPGRFFLEMWHDGTPVEPARYLKQTN